MKILKDVYSVRRYEDLAFAVAHYGTPMHKQLWDLMVDAGFNKKQIFSKYMKVLREISKSNGDILQCVGASNFETFDKKSNKWVASKHKTL
jgi:hypothetical protein